MAKIPCYDVSGNSKGELEVDEKAFDTHVRWSLLKEAVLMYQANQRQGTHSTRTRGERAGSGKKPYRQKGTGRARAGCVRSPLWRKGAVIFGPKPRDYSYRLPKKALTRARLSAIYGKLKDGEVLCFDEFPQSPPKTRTLAQLLKQASLIGGSLLLTIPENCETLTRMTRNIPKVTLKPLAEVNAWDILKNRRWALSRAALDRLLAEVRFENDGGKSS